jgi:hypothetical protein
MVSLSSGHGHPACAELESASVGQKWLKTDKIQLYRHLCTLGLENPLYLKHGST